MNRAGGAGVYAIMTVAEGDKEGIFTTEKSEHSCIFDMDVSSCNSAGD